MTNVHKLSRTWQYLLIFCYVGSVMIFLLPVIIGMIFDSPPQDSLGFVVSAIGFGGLFGFLLYFACSSKIIASPEKIALVYFGQEGVEKTWGSVDKLTINRDFGSIQLVFKEPIYKKRTGIFARLPARKDKTLDISSYIDDYDTVNLLEDIAKYVPQNNILEFVKKYNRKVKTYQKGEVIGLYYLGWLFFHLFPVLVLVASTNKANLNLVFGITWGSLIVGLFANGVSLITLIIKGKLEQGYSAKIMQMEVKDIAREARSHYMSPLVSLLLGFIVGLLIWIVVQSQVVSIKGTSISLFASLFSGGFSLWVSRIIEKLIFTDNGALKIKNA